MTAADNQTRCHLPRIDRNYYRYYLPRGLSLLLENATVERFARAIVEGPPSNGCRSLIALRQAVMQTPLFLAPGVSGESSIYERLARHMDPARSVYAFSNPHQDGANRPFADMAAAAAYYVGELRKFWPKGPYFLGGYSYGGILAFEMAQQLSAQGERVAMLAVIDDGFPQSRPRSVERLLRSVWGSLGNLPNWVRDVLLLTPCREWPRLLADELRQIADLIKQQLAWHESRTGDVVAAEQPRFADLSSGWKQEVNTANYRAYYSYRPSEYAGRVALFRARSPALFTVHRGNDLGWNRFARGGVDVRIIPGNHDNVLAEPHVKVLARELAAAMRKADGTEGRQ